MATRLRAQAYPGERPGDGARARRSRRRRWSSCCCPNARRKARSSAAAQSVVRVLAVPDVEADRHAVQVEGFAQPGRQIAQVAVRQRVGRLVGEQDEGRRARGGLGGVADLDPAALRQRRRMLLQRRAPASGSARRSRPGCPSARAPPPRPAAACRRCGRSAPRAARRARPARRPAGWSACAGSRPWPRWGPSIRSHLFSTIDQRAALPGPPAGRWSGPGAPAAWWRRPPAPPLRRT